MIHERLVTEYGFRGSHQRVKEYLAKERPSRLLGAVDENPLTGLHGRFEVVRGALALPSGLRQVVRRGENGVDDRRARRAVAPRESPIPSCTRRADRLA